MKKMIKLVLLTSVMSVVNSVQAEDNFMVRFRTINVAPSESVEVKGVTGASASAIGGADIQLSNESVAELDFTYFVNKHFGVELILATATHDVAIPAIVSSANSFYDAGSVSLLPPTLLAQYHHEIGNFKPYVGAGVNYTYFYGVKSGAFKDIDYSNSFGIAYQVGFDYKVAENLYVNVDVKKIDIKSDVDLTLHDDTKLATEVEIDPTVVALGLGIKF